MPEVDETLQDRETYGNPPGWSQGRAVLPEGQSPRSVVKPKEAPPEEPSDASAAPSAEEAVETPPQEQESQEGTAPSTPPEPEAKPQEKVWHQPPPERWEELRRQREAAEQRAAQAEQLTRLVLEKAATGQPSVPPAQDPWAGLVDHADPATAQYWQLQRKLIQHEREVGKQEAIQALRPVIEAGTQELARLNLKEFRKENPEIKPASEEERLVISYMNGQMDGVRHPLESAKRNAMYDRLEAENRALKAKQSSVPQKRAAAASEASTGIPQTAGLPGKPKSAVDRASEVADKGGSWMDVAKTFFGG